jgi:hypothetical protein
MMLVLDATVGGVNSNSYVTLAAATAFLQERLHTDPWFALGGIPAAQAAQASPWLMLDGSDQRIAALLSATRLLDEQVCWHGQPLTLTQALAWPMSGQVDHLGRNVPSTSIPVVVQRATAYYALALLRDQSEAVTASTGTAAVKSLKMGETTVVYQDAASTAVAHNPQVGLPAEIRQLLRCYGRMTGGVTVHLVRT